MKKPAASSVQPAVGRDLIRVQGARVNNLKDVSVELPKRRLTVFTGVSGSGKSSLVFSTIAAESQRLINETYSSFVQGFMPSLARPEVDVLDGTDDRDHRGSATDGRRPALHRRYGDRCQRDAPGRCSAGLASHPIGSPNAFSFNVGFGPWLPEQSRSSAAAGRPRNVRKTYTRRRWHVRALRRPRHDLGRRPRAALYDDLEVPQRGRDHHSRLGRRQLLHSSGLRRLRISRPRQGDLAKYSKKEMQRLPATTSPSGIKVNGSTSPTKA